MQVILLHFTDKIIKLKSHEKSVNAPIIEKFTGIKNYKARENQRNSLFSKINENNYETMKKNLETLNIAYIIKNSTNFNILTSKLEK